MLSIPRFQRTFLLLLLLVNVCCPAISQEPVATKSDVSLTRTRMAPIALKSKSQPSDDSSSTGDSNPLGSSYAGSTVTVISSLAIVLGLFGAFVWVSKKTNQASGRNRVIPDEALAILGQKSLGPQASITLVRCGTSLLVVGMHPSGMSRLGEITDQEQIRHLEALCKGESKASFDATLAEIQREPIKRGFTGDGVQAIPTRQRNPLFG